MTDAQRRPFSDLESDEMNGRADRDLDDAEVRALIERLGIRSARMLSTYESSLRLKAIAELVDLDLEVTSDGNLTFGTNGLQSEDSTLFIALLSIVDQRFPMAPRAFTAERRE